MCRANASCMSHWFRQIRGWAKEEAATREESLVDPSAKTGLHCESKGQGSKRGAGGPNRHQSKSNDCQRYSGLAMSRQIESWSDIVKVIHCQGK